MEKASLFEHNEIAYKKLCEMLKNFKTATIDHATGTGKSFIALKYLYEHRDKKFLYLSPTYPIIDQLMDDCYKIGITPEEINVDTMIYRNLLKKDMKELFEKYDGFIFDEYHRTGARETYKKVKELKRLLNKSDTNKKFIGLTATPVRFLDRARNMTNEIFDGHVASKLSLAEAMLEGLLPVPYYINSKIACTEQYEKMMRKIGRLAPSAEKEKLLAEVEDIPNQISSDEKNIRGMLKKYLQRNDGKYIIFCENVDKLEQYEHLLQEWFKDIGEVEHFKVHTYQNKKENKEQLAKFNKTKSKLSVLLCVDVLNEGVHVDDIDGVIFLRKTKSPIIFFQQLGRALSFSGRNKQIKIFDLVNNFGNHNAIDAVFMEFKEEMQRKIKENPENAEKYKEKLNRFKIMDETRDILKKINSVEAQVTPEKIIMSNVSYAVNTLYKAYKDGENLRIFDNKEYKKAYSMLSRYYKYVTNNQFKKLLETRIVLPYELFMSWEERQANLLGFESFYEKELKQNEMYFEKILSFIEDNGRLPLYNSGENEEKNLGRVYYSMLPMFNEEQKNKFISIAKQSKIELTCIEKALLDQKMDEVDIMKLAGMGEYNVKYKIILPEFMRVAIEKAYMNYDSEFGTQLNEILESDEKLIQEKKVEEEKDRYERMSAILNFIEENTNFSSAELTEQIKGTETILTIRDMAAIKRKATDVKRQKLQEAFNYDGLMDMETFCKDIIKSSTREIVDSKKTIRKSEGESKIIIQIIEYMKTHDGKKPDLNSEDIEEQKLALLMKDIENNTKLENEFEEAETNSNSSFYDPLEMMSEIIKQKENNNRLQKIIIESLEFFSTCGRKPVINSNNEEEKKLAIQFNDCLQQLPESYTKSILKMFNSKKSMEKTTSEYIKNLLRKKNEGERDK